MADKIWEFRKWYGAEYGWSEWLVVTERVRNYTPIDDCGRIEFRIQPEPVCILCEDIPVASGLCQYHLNVALEKELESYDSPDWPDFHDEDQVWMDDYGRWIAGIDG